MAENRNAEFNYLLRKSPGAKCGGRNAWVLQSTLVLNGADWLKGMAYARAEVIERTGKECLGFVPLVERALREDGVEEVIHG